MKNILIIIKKELQAYFNSPTAYVVMVAFLLLWEFMFFRSVFLVGQASLRSLFDFLPWIFLVFIPALTMGSIAQEKTQGTLEFLLTRPVKESQLVIGKFIGSLLFVAIALLFMFPIAWSLGKYGNVDWGVVAGQYAASVAMAMVFVALGVLVSSFFKSQISALLTTAIASFFLVIIGFDLATARLPLGFVPVFEYTSVLTHFSSMARGVIDMRDVWYFLSASAIFLTLAYLILLKDKFGSWKKISRNLQIGIVLVICIALVSNIVVSRVHARADLTQEQIYTLSDSTKEVLSGLDDLVNVTFYRSEQLPAQFQPVLRQIKDTLGDYQSFSGGRISITEKNPSGDEEMSAEAASAGVQEVRFNVVSQEEFQIKTGFLGIVVSYGGNHESIPFVENTSDLEYQLTSFIRKLTVEDKPKVVFVSGHGEKSITTDYRFMFGELQNQFEVKEIKSSVPPAEDPADDETASGLGEDEQIQPTEKLEIPEDTTVLVVAGPNQEISAEDRGKIKDFVESGGSTLFLVDGVEIMPQTFSANANQNSFSDFLADEFGITVKQDMVYDLKSNETVSFSSGRMQYLLPYPYWIRSIRAQQTPIASKVENVVLPWASSIELDQGKLSNQGIEITKLLSTTDSGFSQAGQFNLSPEQKFPNKGLSSQLVALAAKSANENGKRFVVVGDSDFLADQYVQNNPQNMAFGIEVLSWLAQEDSLTDIRLKNVTDRTMTFDQESQPNTIKFGNMALAFALPAGIGLVQMTRRKKIKHYSYGQK